MVVMIFVTTSTIVQLILVIREKGKKKFPRRNFCQAIESDGESVNMVSRDKCVPKSLQAVHVLAHRGHWRTLTRKNRGKSRNI